MLHKISLGISAIDRYRHVCHQELIDEVVSLGEELKGLRLCHINSTPFGGGVAELLVSFIPLLRGLGIAADWQVIRGDHRFFTITKGLHNALQGAPFEDIKKERASKEHTWRIIWPTPASWTPIMMSSLSMTLNRPPYATFCPTTTEPNGYGAATSIARSRMVRCGTSCAPTLKSMMPPSLPPRSSSRKTSV